MIPKSHSFIEVDRFDAMLATRFSRARRRQQLEQGLAQEPPKKPLPELIGERMHFHGPIEEHVERELSHWLPLLLSHARERGLDWLPETYTLHIHHPLSYQGMSGRRLPAQIRLPATASSNGALGSYYRASLVLPPRIADADALFAAVRAMLSRVLGDLFLRRTVFARPGWKEALAGRQAAGGVSIGLADGLKVIAGFNRPPASMQGAVQQLIAVGRSLLQSSTAPSLRRCCEMLIKKLEEGQLREAQLRVIDEAVAVYLSQLQASGEAGVKAMISEVESRNRELNFLPIDFLPEYLRLQLEQPLHYLRAAHLRLGFVHAIGGLLLEDVMRLFHPASGAVQAIAPRLQAAIEALIQQGGARPYLLPEAHLTAKLKGTRAQFPLEIDALMQRLPMPPEQRNTERFRWFERRYSNTMQQRLLEMAVIMRNLVRAIETGQREPSFAPHSFSVYGRSRPTFACVPLSLRRCRSNWAWSSIWPTNCETATNLPRSPKRSSWPDGESTSSTPCSSPTANATKPCRATIPLATANAWSAPGIKKPEQEANPPQSPCSSA